ncbi:MAG TPA: hypothetical protein VFQ63_04330, partial [Patescibacteria group bacterium]|nr:hypothetical protein [Patescibacteria group bacterium]
SEKQKIQSKKTIDGISISLVDLMQIIGGNGLFGEQEPIFIEELVSKRKSPKEIEEIATYLTSQKEALITIWESKELTPKQLVFFKGATVTLFKTPTIVFTFLDNIKPGNGKMLLKLYHQLLEQQEAGYVFFMLTRQMRQLLGVKTNAQISEVVRLAPWQKTKLSKQAETFSQEELVSLHQQLFSMELGQKTGTLSQPLASAIDFFLASI